MKIALIGSAVSVAGFRALGVDVYDVARPQEALEVWNNVDPGEYAVIFVTEELLPALEEELELFDYRAMPIISVIPPATGGIGSGLERLRRLVEKAVGTDVFLSD
jgi:V/A-type H+/Na+-transporting ATPase subunit F